MLSVVLCWSVYNNCPVNTTAYAVNTMDCLIQHNKASLIIIKFNMFFGFRAGALYPEYTLVGIKYIILILSTY